MNKKLFAVVGLVLALAGCATEEKLRARLDSHIGQTENQLVQSIGRVPDRVYDTDADHRYIEYAVQWTAGGYTYTVGGSVTPACTGVGILSLELAGKEYHRTHEALRAGSYLLQHPPEVDKPHFFYGVYYTSQAMFQLGDNYWAEYRPRLHGLLLKANPPRANGAWYGNGADDAQYGPAYATAMAILALTVEYRFLPIYQREEK